ncbi:MBOAT family O-acyltransferase [Leptospira vanthielii]|uniref:MBOAT family protein n=1 Tax=Leptospira vanthielii TaxID=293085 RepID=A0ABY2NU79_9LEPT|nr:MBOAT family O-acyltransferase [Leptospira vanthielii]TGM61372.1 MBOAT family protein [Leptospira vanthielii]
MLFNSVHYLIFAPVVILVYFLIPKRFQGLWLFIVSLYFYAIFRIPFLILLVFSFVITKLAVDYMEFASSKSKKLFWLNVAVWSNLSLLFVFKYLDFSITVWNQTFSLTPCDPEFVQKSGILLPMGISFFTLQAVSYAVDVYKGVVVRAKSIFHFGLFLAFFPQLVAGPILRASDVLHQFLDSKDFTKENLKQGLKQLFWGIFKKTFIADPVSYVIDPMYANPTEYNWIAMWMAASLFAVQIYCDFSGYSDIAIGTARILGFHIPKNFDRPFLSGTLSELWRRWHISFSSWLRDYVYITLGGNRRGEIMAYVNLFLTTFVSGIWHGADWTFVFWGTLHSTMMVVEKFVFKFETMRTAWNRVPRSIQPIYPVGVFVLSCFFFRAKATPEVPTGMGITKIMLERAFTGASGIFPQMSVSLVILVGFLFLVDILQDRNEDRFAFITDNLYFLIPTCILLYITSFIIYSVTVSSPFLYFQF